MARGRMISKSLSTSRKFAELCRLSDELGEFSQLLFPLIVAHTDDHGRMSADAFTVKMLALPSSARPLEQFEAALQHMHTVGLLDVYDVNGDKFLQVIDFDKHQTGLHKRIESRIPGNSRKFPEIPTQEKRTEEKGTELNGTEGKVAPLRPRAVQTSGVMAGTLPRDHLNCRQPCIRVCVSEKQHAILRERHGGTDADMDAFYAGVRRNLNGPVGQKPWEFWESQFIARFGTSAPTGKTAGNAAAAARFIARGQS